MIQGIITVELVNTAKNRPLALLGLCLMLGVFLGLMVTWTVRVAQEFRECIQEEGEDQGN